jgi:hypothetical protein
VPSRRETSLRRASRRRYLEIARAENLDAVTLAAKRAAEEAGSAPNRLLALLRFLYEETPIPVRELAQVAAVTERTIYKYAQKLAWRPRVVRLARGAGGRFVTLAELGRPLAAGLKALDPEAAERAAARCVAAGLLSQEAATEALEESRRAAAVRAEAEERETEVRIAVNLLRAAKYLHEADRKGEAVKAKRPARLLAKPESE